MTRRLIAWALVALILAVVWIVGCAYNLAASASRPPAQSAEPRIPSRGLTTEPSLPSPDSIALGTEGPTPPSYDLPPGRLGVGGGASPAVVAVPAATAGPTIAGAKAYALRKLGARQAECLFAIVQRESRWRVDARNRRSGAYGLGQAYPGSKMAAFGADWRTNPVTQLRWMIAYVNGRYGSACRALDHALVRGYY